MKIILLTHPRELERANNTGALALAVAGEKNAEKNTAVQRVIWDRVNPDRDLIKLLEQPNSALVYPDSEIGAEQVDCQQPLDISKCETFVLLDATWQEARKMVNRSAYLKAARRVGLQPAQVSQYRRRRNQKAGGLCTAECVIEILQSKGRAALAAELLALFQEFNQAQ